MINVYRTGQEKVIFEKLTNYLSNTGYGILRIRLFQNKKVKKCQIMIEKADNMPINLQDCETVNKIVAKVKKEELIFLNDYDMEVSSPGVNKPLTRLSDYMDAKEKLVKLYTVAKINDRKKFLGYLKNVDENGVIIELLENKSQISIGFNMILESNLEYSLK